MAQEELKIAGMKLKIDGAAQFQSDLNTCKTTSRALKDELKVLEAGTTSAGKNGTEYLRLKSQALTSELINQEKNTLKLKEALANTTEAYGKDSKEVTKLESEVTKSRIAEEKLKVSLQNNNSELAKAENVTLKAANQMKELGDKAKATGATLNSAGNALTAGITTPAVAATAALAGLVIKTTESADNYARLADKTGLSTERLQELAYVGAKTDTELEVMTGSQSKLIKAMTAARDGTGAQAEAFKSLGVSVVNTDGSLRDSNVVWGEVIDKLGQMPNETEASSTALVLLGKSALDLNPLIKAGSAEIANLSTEAHTAGAVMSGESVEAMDEFSDSIAAAKLSITTAASEITVKMLPTLNELLPIITDDIVPAIGDFANGVGDLIEWFDNLDPIAKTMITNAASYLVLAGPTLKIIGSIAGAYGTFTGAMAANTIAQEMKNAKEAEGAITAAANTAAEATKTGVIVTETVATEGLAVTEEAATVAGAGLAAVLGPIALVVGAVAAGYYVLNNRIGESTKAATEAEKSYKASSDEYENSTSKMQTNANMAKTLGDQLYKLADSENKTNEQKQHMTKLVAQLNQLEPTLSLAIDAQTGALNKTKKSLDDLVESELADCKAQAERNRLTQLYSEELQITEDLTTAKAKLLEEQKKSTLQNLEDQAAWIKAGNSWATFVTGADDAKATIAKLTEDQKVNAKQTSDLTNQMTGLTVATNAQTDANQTASTESTTSTQATQSNTTATEAHTVMLTKDALVINAAAKATRDAAQASKEAAASITGDMKLVSTVFVGATYTVEEWSDKTIAAAGGAQAAILKAKAAYASSGGASLQYSGEYSTSGLISGMLDNNKGVADAATKLADTAANAYNKSMEINSPSRRMGRAAGFTVDGLIEQFKAKEPELAAASLRLADVSARSMTIKPSVSLSAGAVSAGLSSASVASSSVSIDYTKLGAAVAAAMPKSDLTGFTMQLDGRTVGRLIRGTI